MKNFKELLLKIQGQAQAIGIDPDTMKRFEDIILMVYKCGVMDTKHDIVELITESTNKDMREVDEELAKARM